MLNSVVHFILYSQLDSTLIPVALNYEHSLTIHLKEFETFYLPMAAPEKKAIIACHSRKIKNHVGSDVNGICN